MTLPVISVENLGKRYSIRHQATRQGEPYRLLSEELISVVKTPIRALAARLNARGGEAAGKAAGIEEFWALRHVSFQVHEGEVLGIIGRNGAGKSTLLKILSRITDPSEGRVRMRGRVASLLEVGTGFHPELTGRENILLNGAILGMSRAEIRAKFDEIVDFSGIEKFLDTPVKRYSSGMYVRLAFAVAAHLEPDILIVDEVLAVGDAAFQRKSLGKMEDVSRSGRTVFLVSHNMASIRELCGSVVHLEQGTVMNCGATEQVVAEYLRQTVFAQSGNAIPPTAHRVKSSVQITSLEFLTTRGDGVRAFELGESIVMRLGIAIAEPVEKFRVGIGVAAQAIVIATLLSPDLSFADAPRTFDLTCAVPSNVLLPGYYSVDLGAAMSESGRGLDWITDAGCFEILNVTSQTGIKTDEKELGVVRIPVAWNY